MDYYQVLARSGLESQGPGIFISISGQKIKEPSCPAVDVPHTSGTFHVHTPGPVGFLDLHALVNCFLAAGDPCPSPHTITWQLNHRPAQIYMLTPLVSEQPIPCTWAKLFSIINSVYMDEKAHGILVLAFLFQLNKWFISNSSPGKHEWVVSWSAHIHVIELKLSSFKSFFVCKANPFDWL